MGIVVHRSHLDTDLSINKLIRSYSSARRDKRNGFYDFVNFSTTRGASAFN
jgi:hypothetical protein